MCQTNSWPIPHTIIRCICNPLFKSIITTHIINIRCPVPLLSNMPFKYLFALPCTNHIINLFNRYQPSIPLHVIPTPSPVDENYSKSTPADTCPTQNRLVQKPKYIYSSLLTCPGEWASTGGDLPAQWGGSSEVLVPHWDAGAAACWISTNCS